MTEFVLLTGFLGSGKTTLLLDFLAGPDAIDTAVIVNEVGEINIDGAILAEGGRDLPMALLSNGCVCCSIANDLLYTIEALVEGRADSGLPPFRRIILECSGLSRPGPILRSLGELGRIGMQVRIVATYDPRRGALQTTQFDDAVAQLAAADRVVITKLDECDDATLTRAIAAVASITPLAECIAQPDRARRAAVAFAQAAPATTTRDLRPATDHPRIAVLLARFPSDVAIADLLDWLENLAGLCGDRLLRTKGLLRVREADAPLLIQGVGTLFSPPRRFNGAGDEGLVIIARDVDIADIRMLPPISPTALNRLASNPFRTKRARQRRLGSPSGGSSTRQSHRAEPSDTSAQTRKGAMPL
jgi:G3E family GTPase